MNATALFLCPLVWPVICIFLLHRQPSFMNGPSFQQLNTSLHKTWCNYSWLFSWSGFNQEIWRRLEPGSLLPPDLCHRSLDQDAPRWGSCSTNHHIWEHNVFLFVAHRHSTIRIPVKTCAVRRSHINWLPCYVCCLACGDAASPSGIWCLRHKSSFQTY